MPSTTQVEAVVERLARANARHGTRCQVAMGSLSIELTGYGTRACFAGFYLLERKIEDGEHVATKRAPNGTTIVIDANTGTDLEWQQGAQRLAHDLGFTLHETLTDYYDAQPQLWGNGRGSEMFSNPLAFGGGVGAEPTLAQVQAHWERVAQRTSKQAAR